ncbi:MAM domain-containing glycosylphosphatidylinositol anchor protein 2, partial [Eurytemora carolleeae]|uniref:MAM domain-containing glycosylphosphatidylinositol anchor protein 2 n=1 Tax=Eurytemora carolleeae TaxID=1294199 RepID=UPI000C7645B8
NSKDEVLKISHNLEINLPPSIHSLHPGSVVTVEIGSTVRLQCKADGHPKPAVYWSRQHNQAFPGESRQLRSQGDTVILEGVKRDFAGEYFCNADNGVGSSPTVESIQLDVLYPPEVSVEKVYHHVPLGESVTLICFVFANPQPKINWYKNTMKILDGERIVSNNVGNSYKLSIDKLNIQDYGEYSCRAENSLQKDVTQTLQVSGCPAPPTIISDEYSNQKYSYELLWTVQSYYPIVQQEAVLLYNHQFNESGSGEEEVKRIKLSGGDPPFSYNFKGLKNNGTFRVRVKSKNEFGWGPYSSVFTFYMFPREKLPMEIKESKTVEKNAPLTSDQSPVSHSSLFSSLFSLLFSFLLRF